MRDVQQSVPWAKGRPLADRQGTKNAFNYLPPIIGLHAYNSTTILHVPRPLSALLPYIAYSVSTKYMHTEAVFPSQSLVSPPRWTP
jgi:hypothetical protein